MRLFLALILLISVIFIPQYVLAQTAKTIDELVKMYDETPCLECHKDINDIPNEWKNSKHANSIVDPNVLKTWRTFITQGLDYEKQPREWLMGCLQCHAPQIKDASPELVKQIADMVVTAVDDADKAKRDEAIKELSKLNINCLSCHNYVRVAYPFTPDVDLKSKTTKTVYVAKDNENAKENMGGEGFEIIKSEAIKKSEMCAACHHGCPPEETSKTCPTQYTSYIEDYRGKKDGKEACQGCHMKEVEKEGVKWRSHAFLGSRDSNLFAKYIDININPMPTTYIDHLKGERAPALVVNVEVVNNGGHGIPHG